MSWWEPDHVEPANEGDPIAAAFVLRDALQTLTSKQRFVVELRFGLKDGEQYTLDEIAEVMGISEVAVWKLERKAIRNLGYGG